jgi:programmed cell death 6-interacting protein
VKYSTIQFEQINVLYNIAALYSLLAFNQPRGQSEGMKKAYNYFQQSAGAFRYLIDEILPTYPEDNLPIGLDVSTLECLHSLMLAEAAECFWNRAVHDGMKDTLISKLACQVHDFYSVALFHSNKSNSIRSEWVSQFAVKQFHFEAAAQYRAAVDCLNRGKYGEEVSRLSACIQACENGLADSKYVSGSVLEDINGLYFKAKADFARAEKDNDLIYIHTVPEISSLKKIERGAFMSKPLIPAEVANPIKYLKEEAKLRILFEEVLPFAVYQASRAYSEQMDDYVYRNVTVEIDGLISHLHNTLQELQLPGSLDAVEKPLGIPQQLITHSDDVRAKGGLQRIYDSMSDIDKLSTEAAELLEQGHEQLTVEEGEDNMLRGRHGTDRWVRAESRIAGKRLWDEYEECRGYLENSANSDGLVLAKLQQAESLIQLLEKGKEAIARFVPNTRIVRLEPSLQRSIDNLRDVLSSARSLEVYWDQYVSTLKTSVRRENDLFPEIVRVYRELEKADPYRKFEASQFQSVYNNALSKFDKDIQWVQQQKAKLADVCERIKELNNVFVSQQKSDENTTVRKQAIQSLETAHARFQEIQSNLEEGRKFYNSILSKLRAFTDSCRDFVYERRIEGSTLEESIKNNSQPPPQTQSSNNNEPPLPAPRAQHHPGTWTPDRGVRFG